MEVETTCPLTEDRASDPDSDTRTLPAVPAIELVKTGTWTDDNGDAVADPTDGDGVAQAGEIVTYTFSVENKGNVTLSDITLADTIGGVTLSGGPIASLAPGAIDTTTFTGSYALTQTDIDAGTFANTATVTGDCPLTEDCASDPDSDTRTLPAVPAIGLVKTFGSDSVVAGGAGSSFTLVVTNTGNVTLSNVLVEDVVDSRLTVTGVSAAVGANADSDGDAQTVEWLISSLAPNESARITVDFYVDSAVPEANGSGGANEGPNVTNTASVTGEGPQGQPVDDEATDDIDILTEIDLSIVKTFVPDAIEVPQGTFQEFTIAVSNAGPSDAVGVEIEDIVNGFLDISDPDSVVLTFLGESDEPTTGIGTCDVDASTSPPLATSSIDCTVQIPAGQSVLITVNYIAAPFLSADPSPYGTQAGDDFRFVFLNGSVLEGSTDGGPVYLDGVDITDAVEIITSLTRNDLIFDPPGGDPAFEMHLSCSDPFTGRLGTVGRTCARCGRHLADRVLLDRSLQQPGLLQELRQRGQRVRRAEHGDGDGRGLIWDRNRVR